LKKHLKSSVRSGILIERVSTPRSSSRGAAQTACKSYIAPPGLFFKKLKCYEIVRLLITHYAIKGFLKKAEEKGIIVVQTLLC
jgi:hypothetical protein